MGEKYVQEESLGGKYMGEMYVQEEFLGEEWVKSLWVKNIREHRDRWDDGFRSPLLRYMYCFLILYITKLLSMKMTTDMSAIKQISF